MKPLFAFIASGSAVSGTVDAQKIKTLAAIQVPGITSGDLMIQGALDQTSASFSRLLETRTPGSGDLRFATGAGSRFIAWPMTFALPPFLRLETSVAQANPTTLTLLTR